MGTGSFGNVELDQSSSNTAPPQGERPDLKASASAAGPLRFLELRGCETSGFTRVWDPQDGRYHGPPAVLVTVLGALGGDTGGGN